MCHRLPQITIECFWTLKCVCINTGLKFKPAKDPGYLLHILWTLTQRQIPVLTLPLAPKTPSSLERIQWSAQSGSLGHAYFPATLKTFQSIHSAWKYWTLTKKLFYSALTLSGMARDCRVGPFLQPHLYLPNCQTNLIAHGWHRDTSVIDLFYVIQISWKL